MAHKLTVQTRMESRKWLDVAFFKEWTDFGPFMM